MGHGCGTGVKLHMLGVHCLYDCVPLVNVVFKQLALELISSGLACLFVILYQINSILFDQIHQFVQTNSVAPPFCSN